ncbi:5'-3' exonuclease family protein [Actinidia rufa]|uniref:5'-3' exonuclease family protein n=1 Tax=Actinidia rufa TaxID=165716 RepID=A0A7J0EVN0_9ERIC|nr:5'-3' exonuclease family protein [Actinidia rufa]
MGVGGHFWDLLKPYARTEDFDFLRDKRVAVDLSFWIVQHETAIRAHTRNPHLRLTFFRTINLFSKFGAFPVFVVDGTPSPLKSQARIARFFRASGIDLSSLPVAEEGVSVERNRAFVKFIKECVELLELLGMPILKAKGEAEALCAQLNKEGQEPFECYNISHVEAGIGLKRRHLIAISLLVGNDHDLNGVQGIGIDTALRFVKCFSEDEILTRLSEIGRGNTLPFQYLGDSVPSSHKNSPKKKIPHCSLCGHPGSKKVHLKLACDNCSSSTRDGCMQKPAGFKCNCSSCDLDRLSKEQKKNENWQIKVCQKIAMEQNFPNAEIVEMYLSNNNGDFSGGGPNLAWKGPQTEMLELKEMKSKRKKSGLEAGGTPLNSESPTTRSVQLSIKEFYRSSKVLTQAKMGENLAESSENSIGSLKGKQKTSSPTLSKSVRRRLLFG